MSTAGVQLAHAARLRLPSGPPNGARTILGPVARPLLLILQGPVGSFFYMLRAVAEQNGYETLKVNFNGGDWLFCRGGRACNFSGSIDAWRTWLDAFLARSRPAAIVLFGDSRPYHEVAVTAAGLLGIPVWCLEEGYIRPHFVTCELGGNNARSPLRQPPANQLEISAENFEPISENLFRPMARCAVSYYLGKSLTKPFFLSSVHHRNRDLLSDAFLWLRGFYRKVAFYYLNQSFLEHLIENLEGRYFVVALQVHDDRQLLRHGRGWTMERLITESIQSFAEHAASDRHLVLKVHPMDRGHRSYRPFVLALSAAYGCQDRIHVVDDGSIGLMIRHSLGVVTVNSTSGLLALNHGKPLLALGDACYSLPRLATSGTAKDMDRFWRAPVPPDGRLVELFRKRLISESQINGSFYLRQWLGSTAERVFKKIHRDVQTRHQTS